MQDLDRLLSLNPAKAVGRMFYARKFAGQFPTDGNADPRMNFPDEKSLPIVDA